MNNIITSALPLGLDGIKILLHLLNFAILMAGLTLLLYKPVLKFINGRRELIRKQLEENERLKTEAEEKYNTYKTKLDNINADLELKKSNADKEIEAKREAVVNEATKKAKEMLKKAEQDCAQERINAFNNLRHELADAAVEIAGVILEREVSKEENAKIIDRCIEEWSEND